MNDSIDKLLEQHFQGVRFSHQYDEPLGHILSVLQETQPIQYATLYRIHAEGRSLRWMTRHGMGDRRTLRQHAAAGKQFVYGALVGMKIGENKNGGPT